MTTLAMDVRELSFDEIDMVSGAVNWEKVATGAAIVGGALLGAATLPVSAPIVVAVAAVGGASLAGAAGGYLIGKGIVEK